YVRPGGIQEALDVVKASGNGKVLMYAGGTDVIPLVKSRSIPAPDVLVDLKGIPDLDYVSLDQEGGLRTGALASIYDVAHFTPVKDAFPILAQAASSIASTQIQNRGTIAGNICNGVPSADSAPALLCLEASVMCTGAGGEDREIGLRDFFSGPRKTVLEEGEMVREIRVPPVRGKGVYLKLSPRSRMDLAVVGVAVVAETRDGVFTDVRIGLGAVGPTPLRAQGAEALLLGEKVRKEILEEAAHKASEEASPIDDHRASAEYRRLMVEVLVKRGLQQVTSNGTVL
ncbi:MAG: xanthine dehydrogenase family protein subunit M, partial [Deltaproteobacteria bacterium]|nr:xanthine dehydrogenase family protein subunit M [Deltaproteobacteria bacterium]